MSSGEAPASSPSRLPSPSSGSLWSPLILAALGSVAIASVAAGFYFPPMDFCAFHASATALLHGQGMYGTPVSCGISAANLNPPATVWAIAPLGLIGLWPAFTIWTAASLLALLWTLRRVRQETQASWLWLLGWSVASIGGGWALTVGQLTFLLAPLLTLAWLADRSGREVRAGAIMGALVYVKVFLGLFLLYWMWRRAWRSVFAGAAVLAALAIATYAISPKATTEWITALAAVDWYGWMMNASLRAEAARLFGGSNLPENYAPLLTSVAAERAFYVGSAIVILVVSWRALRRTANVDLAWLNVGTTALLLSPLGWAYYVPLWLGPLSAVERSRKAILALVLFQTPVVLLYVLPRHALLTATVGSLATWALVCLWSSAREPRK